MTTIIERYSRYERPKSCGGKLIMTHAVAGICIIFDLSHNSLTGSVVLLVASC